MLLQLMKILVDKNIILTNAVGEYSSNQWLVFAVFLLVSIIWTTSCRINTTSNPNGQH